MSNNYFVMLNTQNGRPTVMTDIKDEVAYYVSKTEADKGAKRNLLGDYFGYEVFCLGKGE
jgi:hypothetical protein